MSLSVFAGLRRWDRNVDWLKKNAEFFSLCASAFRLDFLNPFDALFNHLQVAGPLFSGEGGVGNIMQGPELGNGQLTLQNSPSFALMTDAMRSGRASAIYSANWSSERDFMTIVRKTNCWAVQTS
jgi:hypothetical protein